MTKVLRGPYFRYQKGQVQALFWRLLLLAALVPLVVAAHLIPGLDGSVIENGFRNSLHVIGFAVFAAVAFENVPGGLVSKTVLAVSLAAAVGIVSEFAQMQAGRTDLVDLFRDVAGAAIYVCARLLWSLNYSSGFRRAAARTVSVLIGATIFAPFAYWSGIVGVYLLKSPTILDFEGRFDTHLVRAINADIKIVRDVGPGTDVGNQSGNVRLSGWGRSGIAIATVIYDWSNYSELTFDAEILKGESTNVTVHINDSDNIGRFADTDAGRVEIGRQQEKYRIPIRVVIPESDANKLDLSGIRQIVILARDKRDGTLMRLDNIRLE